MKQLFDSLKMHPVTVPGVPGFELNRRLPEKQWLLGYKYLRHERYYKPS